MDRPRRVSGEIETEIITADDEITVTLNYDSTVFTDSSYGANADGEKGIERTEVYDVQIEVIWCGADISVFLQKFMPQRYKELIEEAEVDALEEAARSG